MTPHVIAELQWLGVNIAPGQLRATCPVCSRHRVKSQEKCLRVYPRQDGATVACWHCGWEAEV